MYISLSFCIIVCAEKTVESFIIAILLGTGDWEKRKELGYWIKEKLISKLPLNLSVNNLLLVAFISCTVRRSLEDDAQW